MVAAQLHICNQEIRSDEVELADNEALIPVAHFQKVILIPGGIFF